MNIRKARLSDTPHLISLWKEFMREHDTIVLKERPSATSDLRRKTEAPQLMTAFFQKNIRSKNSAVFVAEEIELVGYVMAFIKKDPPIYVQEEYGYISDLYIKPNFRRKGLSTQLQVMVKKWCKEKGLPTLSLLVFTGNKRARKVYKKWGMKDSDIRMDLKF